MFTRDMLKNLVPEMNVCHPFSVRHEGTDHNYIGVWFMLKESKEKKCSSC